MINEDKVKRMLDEFNENGKYAKCIIDYNSKQNLIEINKGGYDQDFYVKVDGKTFLEAIGSGMFDRKQELTRTTTFDTINEYYATNLVRDIMVDTKFVNSYKVPEFEKEDELDKVIKNDIEQEELEY